MSSPLPPFPHTDFQYTESPNPTWKYGEKIESTAQGKAWREGEAQGWKSFNTSQEDPT